MLTPIAMASRQLLAVRRRISPRFGRTLSDASRPLSQPAVPSDCRFRSPRIFAHGSESMVYPLRNPCVSAWIHRLPPLCDVPDNVDELVAYRSCSSIFSTFPVNVIVRHASSAASVSAIQYPDDEDPHPDQEKKPAKRETSPEECDQDVAGLSSAKERARRVTEMQKKGVSVLKKLWSIVLQIGPFSKTIVSMSREDRAKKLAHLKEETKDPNMRPSTFQVKIKEQEALKRRLNARIKFAKFLQDTVKEMTKEIKATRTGVTQRTAEALDEFMRKVCHGERVSYDDIIVFAKLFNDELTLDNISRPCLVSMCKYMGIQSYGTDAYLQYMLRSKLAQTPSMQLHTPASESSVHLWQQNRKPYLMIQTPHGIQKRLFSSMQKQGICWSCGRTSFDDKYILICPSCKAIQAPSPAINYFQLFDQDQKYEIDTKDLEANYKSLMKILHPDLTHGKSEREKDNAAQLSALVTTAYNQLLNPVSRASYLLKLQGVHVEEEGTVNDPELILEVMDMRETLESNPDKETLQKLYNSANTRLIHWSNAFNSSLNDGNMTLAVAALQRMSYFGRVCEDIKRELL